MLSRRPPCFAGMPAYYVDEFGAPLFNAHGILANDSDMYKFLDRPDVVRELDRLTFEMCAEDRRRGEKLPPLLLQAELEAFMRQRRWVA